VNRYVDETFAGHDPVLAKTLDASAAGGLPDIQIGAAQGKFLQIMARTTGAKRILEIGTLGGYSTIWLARGLAPDGSVVSLEIDPHRATVARANIDSAGLGPHVEVRVGAALESLRQLQSEGGAPFDMVFMDADEPNYVAYLEAILPMSRVGTLIVADNVVRQGDVADQATENPRAQGARLFNAAVAEHPRLMATLIPLVGENNLDGMVIALVIA